MNNNDLINKIFSNTISSVIKDIDEKYRREINIAYRNHLNEVCSNFDNKGLTKEQLENIIIRFEKSRWESSNAKIKLSILLKDEAFNNIKSISNSGYKYALQMLENKSKSNDEVLPVIDKEVCNKNINKMAKLITNVREFNVELAKMYVSEGTLDYIFASENTKYTSLRIGRIRQQNNSS